MPRTARGISFDADGICNLCRDYRPSTTRGEEALRLELDRCTPGEERPHDCLVPVSGGRDSAYTLYYVTRVLGRRPIAFHNDNDFETEIARENLRSMTKALDVPLVTLRAPDQLFKSIVAEKFMMNAPYGPDLVVQQTCEACEFGFESGAYNTARREGVPVIIWGDSSDESTDPYLSGLQERAPPSWRRLLSPEGPHLLRYKLLMRQLEQEYGAQNAEGLTELHLFDYIEWDRKTIVDTIRENLGWRKPDDSATSWRIDCCLVPLVNHLTRRAYGVSKIEIGFSNMVRNGKMDREQAIAQVETIDRSTLVTDLEQFLRQMGIPRRAIQQVLR